MKTGLRALWYIIWYPCRYLFAFTLFAQAVRIADTDPSGSGISVVLGLICTIPEIIKIIKWFIKSREKSAQAAVAGAPAVSQTPEAPAEPAFSDIPDYPIAVEAGEAERLYYDWLEDLRLSWFSISQLPETVGRYVVVDVETTGLMVGKSEIIQVAAIRFENFEPVEKFVTYCRPHNGLRADAAAVNGITADLVSDKPFFGQIAKSLEEFIGDRAIVGHNVRFDAKFIQKYGVDLKAKKHKFYDTVAIAKRQLQLDNYKLGTVCQALGVKNVKQHDAAADALATGEVFAKFALEFYKNNR